MEGPGTFDQGDKSTVEQILRNIEDTVDTPEKQADELERYLDTYGASEYKRILDLSLPNGIAEYSAEAMKWRDDRYQETESSDATILGRLTKKRAEVLSAIEKNNVEARTKRLRAEKIATLVDHINRWRDQKDRYISSVSRHEDYRDANTDRFDEQIHRFMQMLEPLESSN